jgi:hypothetical protein
MAEKRKLLDAEGIEAICERLIAGETQTAIAADIGVSKGLLCAWLAEPEHSARAREARILAASAYADLALAAIKDAPDPFELARARELASHYRWQASKASPQEYGDKVETTHKGEVQFTAIERRIVTS